MKVLTFAVFVLLSVSLCVGQTSPSATAPSASQDSGVRGAFPTSLVKGLDSKKLKDGDPVICQTMGTLHTNNGMMVPSGSKVIGHVTQAKARSKGDADSTLAIVFDKIEVSKGQDIPMKGILQAVGPSLGSSGPDTGGLSGSGQMMAGHGGDSTMAPPSGGVAGPNSGVHPIDNTGTHPILNAQSTGVLGIKNLQMDKDSVLTSSGKEVKLDNGTQMLIRADIHLPVQ